MGLIGLGDWKMLGSIKSRMIQIYTFEDWIDIIMPLNETGTQEAQMYLGEDDKIHFEYVEFEVTLGYPGGNFQVHCWKENSRTLKSRLEIRFAVINLWMIIIIKESLGLSGGHM